MLNIIRTCVDVIKNKINGGTLFILPIRKFGEKNDNKIIYFITDISSIGSGLYSLYLSIIDEITFAHLIGWIPVIDDTAGLLRKTKISFRKGKNPISDYFMLNNSVTVEDVFQSKYVIINRDLRINRKTLFRLAGKEKEYEMLTQRPIPFYDESRIKYYRKLAKENCIYKDKIRQELERAYQDTIGDKKKVLGVAVREGKMGFTEKNRKLSGESRQPTIPEIISMVNKYKDIWKCKHVYLSCQSNEIVNLFLKEFGVESVLYLKRTRWPLEEYLKICSINNVKDSKKKNWEGIWQEIDMSYMKDMYILSKCNSVLIPINCGTMAAFLQSDGYDNFYIME